MPSSPLLQSSTVCILSGISLNHSTTDSQGSWLLFQGKVNPWQETIFKKSPQKQTKMNAKRNTRLSTSWWKKGQSLKFYRSYRWGCNSQYLSWRSALVSDNLAWIKPIVTFHVLNRLIQLHARIIWKLWLGPRVKVEGCWPQLLVWVLVVGPVSLMLIHNQVQLAIQVIHSFLPKCFPIKYLRCMMGALVQFWSKCRNYIHSIDLKWNEFKASNEIHV